MLNQLEKKLTIITQSLAQPLKRIDTALGHFKNKVFRAFKSITCEFNHIPIKIWNRSKDNFFIIQKTLVNVLQHVLNSITRFLKNFNYIDFITLESITRITEVINIQIGDMIDEIILILQSFTCILGGVKYQVQHRFIESRNSVD